MTEVRRMTPPNSLLRLAVTGGLAFVTVVGLFLPTASEVASIWWRSQTFAHGLVVLPIMLWLLWGMRAELVAQPLKPAWSALVPLALAGFGWLVGESASVAAASHFSLAAMLFCAVWVVWGHALTRQALFPLAFLFFGVPFGEFLVPSLMNHTADFTVSALRLTGVPVFREGNSFVIPSGSWSVVEACSGIRYLIASVMVGVLFAWLNYVSLRRRVLFIIAAILVPLVANWMRAYLIVMLGHLSGNRLATGVDHLIYGWLFFGVVILALFWVGALWRETDAAHSGAAPSALPAGTSASSTQLILVGVAVVALSLIWPPLEVWMARTPGSHAYRIDPLRPADGWHEVEASVKDWSPTYSGERARFQRTYRKGDGEVTLFIAYYAQQVAGSELVQWDNRLVTAEEKAWRQIADEPDTLDGMAVRYNQILGTVERIQIWSWLWLGDATTADPREAKLALVADRFARRPDDSAAVIVYARQDDPAVSTKPLVQAFVVAHRGEIERILSRTPRD